MFAVRTARHKLIRRGQAVFDEALDKVDCMMLGAPPFRGEKDRPLKDRFDYHNALPKLELYDLESDPFEVDNLAKEHTDTVAELNALLEKHIATNPKRWIENAG